MSKHAHKKNDTDTPENPGSTPEAASTAEAGAATRSTEAPRAEAGGEGLAVLAEKDELIAKLQEEVSSLKDQYLRKLADYENFRKRMFREKDEAVGYANSQLLSDLVGVLDDFDRAVKSSESSRDFQSLHDGVAMIHRSLLNTLETKYALSRYDSQGEPFDPNKHEAMMSVEGECDEPVVAEEYVKGYMLKDRVLRSAKVKVMMPNKAAGAAETE